MYIPKHFAVTDWTLITDFVAQVGSVDLVTVSTDGQPISTLLPVIWDTANVSETEFGTLVMHMALQNEQWKAITDECPALAIVHGPQGYISPSNYENKLTDHRVVPTWNYQAVHLSGKVSVSHDPEQLRHIVSDLTDFHEHGRAKPWSAVESDPKYFEGQLKAIVAIRMKVTKVEAKAKLSQNRSENDQHAIINDLGASSSSPARDLAQAMLKNLEKN
jgi:transcriptional regulator